MTSPVGSATSARSASSQPLDAAHAPLVIAHPAALDDIQDLLSQVVAMTSEMQSEQSESASLGAKSNANEQKMLEAERQAELDRAKKAAEEGGFFKKLSGDIGIVGLVGLCTFNYELVGADVAMHETGLVKDMKVDVLDGACALAAQVHPELLAADILLRKVNVTPEVVKKQLDDMGLGTSVPGVSDEDVKPLIDTAVKVNMLVAGSAAAVLSAGTTTALVVALIGVALSSGAFVSEEAKGPEWLSLGLQIAGGVASLGGGFLSSGTRIGERSLQIAASTVSKGVQAANLGMTGTDTIVNAVHERAADDATERAQAVKNLIAKLQHVLDDLIDAMNNVETSKERTVKSATNALDTHGQTLLACASMKA